MGICAPDSYSLAASYDRRHALSFEGWFKASSLCRPGKKYILYHNEYKRENVEGAAPLSNRVLKPTTMHNFHDIILYTVYSMIVCILRDTPYVTVI